VTWLLQYIFPTTLKVDRHTIKIPGLVRETIRIVHLTDFHYDFIKPERISKLMLDHVVEVTNSHYPDLVLLTGDYVEYTAMASQELASKWLSRLSSKYGTFAVLGNHDYKEGKVGRDIIVKALTDVGIKVLDCEVTYPLDGDPAFQLVGLGDWTSRKYGFNDFRVEEAFTHVVEGEDKNITRIVLSHQPDSAINLSKYNIHLQLSGHVHGGQICLPWNNKPLLSYLNNIAKKLPNFLQKYIPHHLNIIKNWDWAQGLHRVQPSLGSSCHSNNLLYVNRGLATHPPLRFYCPAEVAVIDLYR